MNDNFPITGHVKITDAKTGKVLVNKHNMIVANGRRYLLSLFLGKNSDFFSKTSDDSEKDLSDYKLSSIKFGDGQGICRISQNNLLSPISNGVGIKFSSENAQDMLSYDLTNLSITITATISGEKIINAGAKNISELGIFLAKDGSSDEAMFSRIVFDPVPLSQSAFFILQYKINFGGTVYGAN